MNSDFLPLRSSLYGRHIVGCRLRIGIEDVANKRHRNLCLSFQNCNKFGILVHM